MCNNCFNGCTQTTSDKCIKYTGIDFPELNISNGDKLSVVLESINKAIMDLNGYSLTTTTTTLEPT